MQARRTLFFCTLIVSLLPSSLRAGAPSQGAPEPNAIRNVVDALRQSASVVEARVASVEYKISSTTGPWTEIRLVEVLTKLGRKIPESLTLRQRGGKIGEHLFSYISGTPVFHVNYRYLIFLIYYSGE